jgi:hypothetical protein
LFWGSFLFLIQVKKLTDPFGLGLWDNYLWSKWLKKTFVCLAVFCPPKLSEKKKNEKSLRCMQELKLSETSAKEKRLFYYCYSAGK